MWINWGKKGNWEVSYTLLAEADNKLYSHHDNYDKH